MKLWGRKDKISGKGKRKKQIFFISLAVLLILSLVLQSGVYANHKSGAWTPDYPKVDISKILKKDTLSSDNYRLLYAQTGLTGIGVDGLLASGNDEKILKIQEEFFTVHSWINEPFAPFTCSDRLDVSIPLAGLEDGDIIISPNSHISYFRSGHAALVVDADNGRIINATGYGSESGLEDATELSCRPGFMVLRPRAERDTRSKVAEYTKDNLTGLKYSLLAGLSGGEEIKTTQCSHLVWYAYKQFGIDLDSNGGAFVWPKDIANSPELELVQVYGIDPNELWK